MYYYYAENNDRVGGSGQFCYHILLLTYNSQFLHMHMFSFTSYRFLFVKNKPTINRIDYIFIEGLW